MYNLTDVDGVFMDPCNEYNLFTFRQISHELLQEIVSIIGYSKCSVNIHGGGASSTIIGTINNGITVWIGTVAFNICIDR